MKNAASPDKLASMHDWAQQLRSENPKLARQIDVSNVDRTARLESLGLPHYNSVASPLDVFLQRPEPFFDALGSKQFWVQLLPTGDETLRQYGTYNLTQAEATAYVDDLIVANEIETSKYQLMLSECFNNIVSGNVVIGLGGGVTVEAILGSHTPLVRWAASPDFLVDREEFTRIFKYHQKVNGVLEELQDETLKIALHRVIEAIPHWGEARDKEYMPGYYEFTCARRELGSALEPIFFEYQRDAIYLVPE